MTKKKLLENLKNGEVVVTFKKKDGTIRVMKCTQSFDNIPAEFHPKTERVIKDKNLISVWDIENLGWRSFNYKSIIKK